MTSPPVREAVLAEVDGDGGVRPGLGAAPDSPGETEGGEGLEGVGREGGSPSQHYQLVGPETELVTVARLRLSQISGQSVEAAPPGRFLCQVQPVDVHEVSEATGAAHRVEQPRLVRDDGLAVQRLRHLILLGLRYTQLTENRADIKLEASLR